jgi:hypothetical protein
MFKKDKMRDKNTEPVQIENEDEEEYEDEEDLEVKHNEPKLKKQEVSTKPAEDLEDTEDELTEEAVRYALGNLSHRIGRIEHHLRLDYY